MASKAARAAPQPQSPTALLALFVRAFWAGLAGSLAMMLPGFAFRWAGMRVGHYGPKFAQALFGELQPPLLPVVLIVQHFVIGWLSALPLIAWWIVRPQHAGSWTQGALYGLAYYALVNAWLLPRMFGDPLPWQLGWATVLPSLVVHVVFGLGLAWADRRWLRRHGAQGFAAS